VIDRVSLRSTGAAGTGAGCGAAPRRWRSSPAAQLRTLVVRGLGRRGVEHALGLERLEQQALGSEDRSGGEVAGGVEKGAQRSGDLALARTRVEGGAQRRAARGGQAGITGGGGLRGQGGRRRQERLLQLGGHLLPEGIELLAVLGGEHGLDQRGELRVGGERGLQAGRVGHAGGLEALAQLVGEARQRVGGWVGQGRLLWHVSANLSIIQRANGWILAAGLFKERPRIQPRIHECGPWRHSCIRGHIRGPCCHALRGEIPGRGSDRSAPPDGAVERIRGFRLHTRWPTGDARSAPHRRTCYTTVRSDHAAVFKQLLTAFFVAFLERFAPDLLALLDRDTITFFDKERKSSSCSVRCRISCQQKGNRSWNS
jgi:hypothetical protein